MAAQQTPDLKAAMSGTWSQPRPLVFTQSHELPDAVICRARDLVLRVEQKEINGVAQRLVTLTNLDNGFMATGILNLWYARIDWGNGAVWHKTAEEPEPEEIKVEDVVTDPLLQEVVTLVEAEEDRVESACCSFFDRGIFGRSIFQGKCCPQSACGSCPQSGCGSCPQSGCGVFQGGCPTLQSCRGSREVAPAALAKETPKDVLSVGIVSARGLAPADPAHSQVSCRCQIEGKADSDSFRTPGVSSSSPTWNFARRLEGYVSGDSLEFTLWDLTYPLGRVVLTSDQFRPSGFKGELPVAGAGQGVQAFLSVDIQLESALVGLLSERQVGNVVGRVKEAPGFQGLVGEAGEDVRKLVETVNKWLPQALAQSASKEWRVILEHLMDEAEDVEGKAGHLAAKLKDAFYAPLAEAVSNATADAGPVASEGIKLTKLIVAKVVEELVETTTHELEVMGLHIPVRDNEAQA